MTDPIHRNLFTHVVLLIAALSLSSCMQIQYLFVSPGRVEPKNLAVRQAEFSKVADDLSREPKGNYEAIGHGSGSWRYYPMGVNRNGVVYGNGYRSKKTPALGITELMDISVGIDPAMSIEIDAHYAPKGNLLRSRYPEDGAYIMHDAPDWEQPRMKKDTALSYMHDNTVRIALDHFVRRDYYRKAKIYIELKTMKNCEHVRSTNSCCRPQSVKLASELKDYAADYSRENGENWLCITSFSPAALTSFRNALHADLRDSFHYVLILGYTGGPIKSWVAQLKGHVPRFDERIQRFAAETDWLGCLWFSAQGIPEFGKAFNEIQIRRESAKPPLRELEFSYSTYQKKPKGMKHMMGRPGKLKVNFRSFVLDLDYCYSDLNVKGSVASDILQLKGAKE